MNEARKPDLDVGDWLTEAVVKETDYAPGGPQMSNGMTMRELAKFVEDDDGDLEQRGEERPLSPE